MSPRGVCERMGSLGRPEGPQGEAPGCVHTCAAGVLVRTARGQKSGLLKKVFCLSRRLPSPYLCPLSSVTCRDPRGCLHMAVCAEQLQDARAELPVSLG